MANLDYERQILIASKPGPGERRIGQQWREPGRDCQLTLFPVNTAEALADAGVSRDELNHRNVLGWLSDELIRATKFDRPEMLELAFVRNVARSGLTESQITVLLERLAKPYAYDVTRIAYSFAYGWVELPIFFEEMRVPEIIEQFMDQWVHETASSDPARLRELRNAIDEALASGDE